MKPVAIFRHARSEGPGYFATFLDENNIPWRLLAIDEGELYRKMHMAFSGLVFMGGPMSVNDDLPWISPVLALIRQAVAAGIPVLGHCLGGQLMAKALGGTVGSNPIKEIGWGEVVVAENNEARAWFGETRVFDGISLAWRDLFSSVRRNHDPEQCILPESGFCNGPPPGNAVPCGNDGGNGERLVCHRRRGDCCGCNQPWCASSWGNPAGYADSLVRPESGRGKALSPLDRRPGAVRSLQFVIVRRLATVQ